MIRVGTILILCCIYCSLKAQGTESDSLHITLPDISSKEQRASILEEQSDSSYSVGNIEEAISFLKEANRLRGMTGNNPEKIASNLIAISHYYYELGNFESALIYLKLYTISNGNYKQQLFYDKNADLERLHQLEVKALEEQRDNATTQNTQLSRKVDQLTESVQNWKITTVSLGLAVLILGSISIIFLRRKRPKEKVENVSENDKSQQIQMLEKEMEAGNKDLEETGDLVKVLTEDGHPKESGLKKILPDIVFFYKPKGKAGGDFFWYHHYNNNLILVVGDSNWNGIQGGLVSGLVKNSLEHTVKEEKIFTPSMVMTLVDQQLRQKLEYDEENPIIGVSLSYLLINLRKLQVEFAGAGSSIFYSENGKMKSQSGNILPAGNTFSVEKFYNTYTIHLKKGEMIYACTDGFTHQIGYKEGKRFMREPFRKLLESSYTKKASEQFFIFEKVHKDWKGLKPQTDDILIIGLRL